jgi:hypothetical protein
LSESLQGRQLGAFLFSGIEPMTVEFCYQKIKRQRRTRMSVRRQNFSLILAATTRETLNLMRFILTVVLIIVFAVPRAVAKESEITATNLFSVIRKLENIQHARNKQIADITGRTPILEQAGECKSEKSETSLITNVHTTLSRDGQTMSVLLFLNPDLLVSPEIILKTFGEHPTIRKKPSVGIHSVSLEYEYARKLGWTNFWFELSDKKLVLRYVDIVYRHDSSS